MGKQGAHELNYSSDIDLIILYDAMTPLLDDPHEAATFFVRFTRRLVQIMQDVTEDGYVFRTDLRLQARSAGHTGGDLDRCGGGLLPEPGPELGARRHDQGAALGGRLGRSAMNSSTG